MTTVHLQHDGRWAACQGCELPYHVPGMTVEAASQLPEAVLWALLTAIDPPSFINPAGQLWWQDRHMRMHRDFGLLAFIYEETPGRFMYEWWADGGLHRTGDRPAQIYADGTLRWWLDGAKHRGGGRPAVIYPDGRCEYWVQNRHLRDGGPGSATDRDREPVFT